MLVKGLSSREDGGDFYSTAAAEVKTRLDKDPGKYVLIASMHVQARPGDVPQVGKYILRSFFLRPICVLQCYAV